MTDALLRFPGDLKESLRGIDTSVGLGSAIQSILQDSFTQLTRTHPPGCLPEALSSVSRPWLPSRQCFLGSQFLITALPSLPGMVVWEADGSSARQESGLSIVSL